MTESIQNKPIERRKICIAFVHVSIGFRVQFVGRTPARQHFKRRRKLSRANDPVVCGKLLIKRMAIKTCGFISKSEALFEPCLFITQPAPVNLQLACARNR